MELQEPIRMEYRLTTSDMQAAVKLINKWVSSLEKLKLLCTAMFRGKLSNDRETKVFMASEPPAEKTATPKPASVRTTMLGWIVILSFLVIVYVLFRKPDAMAAKAQATSWKNAFLSFLPYFIILVAIWFFFLRKLRGGQGSDVLVTAIFTREGATWETHDTREENKWTAFKAFSENADVFVLQADKLVFRVVPKRVMAQEQIEQLRGLFQANVGMANSLP